MSTCVPPITRSPGFLYLEYVHTSQGLQHTVAIRFTHDADITDITEARLTATDWAINLYPCMTAQFSIQGWGIRNADGDHYYSEAFVTPYPGTHGGITGMQDAVSSTVSITGQGLPPSPGVCYGRTKHTFHTGAAFTFSPKRKFTNTVENAPLDDLGAWLFAQSHVWADYYGQEASVHVQYPVQYHAGYQRKWGT